MLVGEIDVRRLMICLVQCLVLASSAAGSSSSVIDIGSAFEPPLSNLQRTGMIDLLLEEAFSRAGLSIEITQLPAERSLILANDGVTDGDLLRIGGLDRLYPNLIQVPEPSIDFEFVCFTRSVTSKIDDWEDLKPYSVGIVTGWKILEESVDAEIVTKVTRLETLMTLLANDRIDIVIYERLEGYAMVERLGIEGVRVLGPPLAVRQMFLYLHRRHESLVPRLATILRDIKQDGTYARLEETHLAPLKSRVESWAD